MREVCGRKAVSPVPPLGFLRRHPDHRGAGLRGADHRGADLPGADLKEPVPGAQGQCRGVADVFVAERQAEFAVFRKQRQGACPVARRDEAAMAARDGAADVDLAAVLLIWAARRGAAQVAPFAEQNRVRRPQDAAERVP